MKLYNVTFWNGFDYELLVEESYLIAAENKKQSIEIAKGICDFSDTCEDEDICSDEIFTTGNGFKLSVSEDNPCISYDIADTANNNRPIKVSFDEYPCPKNSSIICEYAKEDKSEDMVFCIKCVNYGKEGCRLLNTRR